MFVCLFVCLSVCVHNNSKSRSRIITKLIENVNHNKMKAKFNFGWNRSSTFSFIGVYITVFNMKSQDHNVKVYDAIGKMTSQLVYL